MIKVTGAIVYCTLEVTVQGAKLQHMSRKNMNARNEPLLRMSVIAMMFIIVTAIVARFQISWEQPKIHFGRAVQQEPTWINLI
jgi:hypothetical protein